MSSPVIKTRFAPSPTGLLHLGNVRTALFNALYARHCHGIFLLRIEDTDQERSRPEYTRQLMEDLRWLGLAWQEGPEAGGAHAPYRQAERGELYAEYYRQLEAQGQVYPCFCSPQELSISRKLQRAAGQAPRYAGTCAHLSQAEIEAKLAQGLQPSLRFRVPRGGQVVFHDLVRGEQRFSTDDLGDFIIRRADFSPAFFFCNAIDDAVMGVSHVLRGEDHLTNTPRQLLILRALGLPEPAYGHISMIVGDDGTPLSKRHGSQSLQELRDNGWLPEGLVNYLARLGHAYTQDDFMPFEQLAEHFALERLGRAPARFDLQQMKYWQQQAIFHLDDTRLWQWLGQSVRDQVPPAAQAEFLATLRPNLTSAEDGLRWAGILFSSHFPQDADARQEIENAGPAFFSQAAEALVQAQGDWQQMTALLKQTSGKKGKGLFMPLRAALTGLTHGPDLPRLLALMGLARAQHRLQNAGIGITPL